MLAEVSLGYYNYMREEVKDAGFKIFYMQADHVAICMKGRLKTAITSVQLSESIDRWYGEVFSSFFFLPSPDEKYFIPE